MRMRPAISESSRIFERRSSPSQVAEAPNVMKVMEKPTMNITEFNNTVRVSELDFCWSFS